MSWCIGCDPVHAGDDRADMPGAVAIEDFDGVNRHAACHAIFSRRNGPGHMRAVTIVVLGAGSKRGRALSDASGEVGIAVVDAGVKHIDVHTRSLSWTVVSAVQWELALVDAIQTPAAGRRGGLELTCSGSCTIDSTPGRLICTRRPLRGIGGGNDGVALYGRDSG